jgi:ribosome maturation factor RimP
MSYCSAGGYELLLCWGLEKVVRSYVANGIVGMSDSLANDGMTASVESDGVEMTPLWRTIEEVATSEGVELFDIEIPRDGGSGRSGVVRVYITKQGGSDVEGVENAPERRNTVTFEDCVRVTKRLLDLDEQEAFVPGHCVLEVSSPGINRTLRLPTHFAGAVGERVRLKFRNERNGYQVTTGTLRSVREETLEVESEEKAKEVLLVKLQDVKEARVDFKF